jgi:hypothetical protein
MIRRAPQHFAMRTLAAAGFTGASVGVVLLLAACGSSSSSRKASAAQGNGLASKSPVQILAAAQAALRSADGFVITGALTENGQQVRIAVVDERMSTREVKFSEGGGHAEVIVLPRVGYVRADQAFWIARVGAQAATLANRWIELPATASQQLTSSFANLAPNTLSRCLGEDLGALSLNGTTTVDGKAAVVIRQGGNVPGSSPGTIAVATDGPAYPLRITSTGPGRPGGTVDACNTGKGGDTEGTITLSDFNHPPAVTAPKHPVKPRSTSTPLA